MAKKAESRLCANYTKKWSSVSRVRRTNMLTNLLSALMLTTAVGSNCWMLVWWQSVHRGRLATKQINKVHHQTNNDFHLLRQLFW